MPATWLNSLVICCAAVPSSRAADQPERGWWWTCQCHGHHDHDATDLGVDDVQDEGELHLLLADNGGEGEDGAGGTC